MILVARVRAGWLLKWIIKRLQSTRLGSLEHPHILILESCVKKHSSVKNKTTWKTLQAESSNSSGAGLRSLGPAQAPWLGSTHSKEHHCSEPWFADCVGWPPWTLLALNMQRSLSWASLVTQLAKNLPAMQETRVQSLDREDPLEKG